MDEKIKESILRAADTIQKGGLVVYPTDTIWGIGCDARNEEAVRRLVRLKGRNEDKGFILLAADFEWIRRSNPEIISTDFLKKSAAHAEPFTMVYPRLSGCAPSVYKADKTIAIRVARRGSFCIELIRKVGFPIVSTSANFSGEPFPMGYEDIDARLLAMADYATPSFCVSKEEQSATPSALYKIDPLSREWKRLR